MTSNVILFEYVLECGFISIFIVERIFLDTLNDFIFYNMINLAHLYPNKKIWAFKSIFRKIDRISKLFLDILHLFNL